MDKTPCLTNSLTKLKWIGICFMVEWKSRLYAKNIDPKLLVDIWEDVVWEKATSFNKLWIHMNSMATSAIVWNFTFFDEWATVDYFFANNETRFLPKKITYQLVLHHHQENFPNPHRCMKWVTFVKMVWNQAKMTCSFEIP